MPRKQPETNQEAVGSLLSLIKNKSLAQILGALIVLAPTLGSYAYSGYQWGIEQGWWGKRIGKTEEANSLLTSYYFGQDFKEEVFNLDDGDSISVRIYSSGDLWIRRSVDDGGTRPYVQTRWFTKRKLDVVLAELREWKAMREGTPMSFLGTAYAGIAGPAKECSETLITEDDTTMTVRVVCPGVCEIVIYDKVYGEIISVASCAVE